MSKTKEWLVEEESAIITQHIKKVAQREDTGKTARPDRSRQEKAS